MLRDLLERLARFAVDPAQEWRTIATTPVSVDRLIRRTIVPLSILPVLATVFGMCFFDADWSFTFGFLVPRDEIFRAGVTTLFCSMGSVFALAAIFCVIAPLYRSRRSYTLALNLATFGALPVWLSGALLVMPALALVSLFALFHTLYLYFVGARVVLGVEADSRADFVGISLVLLAVISTVVGAVISATGIA